MKSLMKRTVFFVFLSLYFVLIALSVASVAIYACFTLVFIFGFTFDRLDLSLYGFFMVISGAFACTVIEKAREKYGYILSDIGLSLKEWSKK